LPDGKQNYREENRMISNTTGTTAIFAGPYGDLFSVPVEAWDKFDDEPNQRLTVPFLAAGKALVQVEDYEEISQSEFVGFAGPDGVLPTLTVGAVCLREGMDTLIEDGRAFHVEGVKADGYRVLVTLAETGPQVGTQRREFAEDDPVTVVRA
jgi:hypothetical protein